MRFRRVRRTVRSRFTLVLGGLGAAIAVGAAGSLTLVPSAGALGDAATPVQPAGQVLDVPASVDATGATDVSAALNRFLASVPDDSVVRFKARGSYRVEETVEMVGKSRVLLDGQGALLFATTTGDRGRAHLAITEGTDITVRSLSIRGPNRLAGPEGPYNPDLEAQHGVRVLGGVRIRLEGLTVSEVWGDMVYVGRTLDGQAGGPPRASTDVVITKCRLKSSGRQGIALTTATRVLIDSNRIMGSRRSIIDMEPNSAAFGGVSDVTVSNNAVSAGRFNFVAAGGMGPVNNVWLLRNRGVNKALSVVITDRYGTGRVNWRIAGNVSNEPYGSLKVGVVVARGASGVVYEDNVQPVQKGRRTVGLLAVEKTCGAMASGNDLDGAPQLGGRSAPCKGESLIRPPQAPAPATLPSEV